MYEMHEGFTRCFVTFFQFCKKLKSTRTIFSMGDDLINLLFVPNQNQWIEGKIDAAAIFLLQIHPQNGVLIDSVQGN